MAAISGTARPNEFGPTIAVYPLDRGNSLQINRDHLPPGQHPDLLATAAAPAINHQTMHVDAGTTDPAFRPHG